MAVIGGLLIANLGGPAAFGGAVLIGALLVWQLEGKRQTPKPKAIFCGECGEQIRPAWKHCPVCGSKNWKAE